MKEIVFICPVCGRIHAVNMAFDYLMLVCNNCNSSMLVHNLTDGSFTLSLVCDCERTYEDILSAGNKISLKILNGIPVPMKNGKSATFFVDNRFFYLQEHDVNKLHQAYLEKGLDTALPLGEALSKFCPEDAQTVDVEKLKSQLGDIRWSALTSRYPNPFMETDSYGYYKVDGFLPVYICLSTNYKKIQAFLNDTHKCGMVTRELHHIGSRNQFAVFAVDPSPYKDDCHLDIMNRAICDFLENGLTIKIANSYREEPFPEEREFNIYTTWKTWGISSAIAKNAKEAASMILSDDCGLPDGEYVSGSQEIDEEMGIIV